MFMVLILDCNLNKCCELLKENKPISEIQFKFATSLTQMYSFHISTPFSGLPSN